MVRHAPEDAPAEKTLVLSALFCVITYCTIWTMAAFSPVRPGLASQQLAGESAAMMMNPYWSDRDWNQPCAAAALPPQ